MPFCATCGTRTRDGTRFCENCGALLSSSIPTDDEFSASERETLIHEIRKLREDVRELKKTEKKHRSSGPTIFYALGSVEIAIGTLGISEEQMVGTVLFYEKQYSMFNVYYLASALLLMGGVVSIFHGYWLDKWISRGGAYPDKMWWSLKDYNLKRDWPGLLILALVLIALVLLAWFGYFTATVLGSSNGGQRNLNCHSSLVKVCEP